MNVNMIYPERASVLVHVLRRRTSWEKKAIYGERTIFYASRISTHCPYRRQYRTLQSALLHISAVQQPITCLTSES